MMRANAPLGSRPMFWAVISAFVIAALFAASAARGAEYGVCQHGRGRHSQHHQQHYAFTDSLCQAPSATHEGPFEWYAWPTNGHKGGREDTGEADRFSSYTDGTFVLTGGEITCSVSGRGTGSILSATSADVSLRFLGCEGTGDYAGHCKSAGTKSLLAIVQPNFEGEEEPSWNPNHYPGAITLATTAAIGAGSEPETAYTVSEPVEVTCDGNSALRLQFSGTIGGATRQKRLYNKSRLQTSLVGQHLQVAYSSDDGASWSSDSPAELDGEVTTEYKRPLLIGPG